MLKDLLTVEELSAGDLDNIFRLAADMKANRRDYAEKPLRGKSVGMIFSKSSTRTRVSFEVGIVELGGYPLYLDTSKMQVGRGESIPDTAKVLSRYLHAIVIRTHDHGDVVELARNANIPVINALTDRYHPCQILTDLFTIREFSQRLEGVKVVFIGDGSCNMANSMILAAKLAGLELTICAPEEFRPDDKLMSKKFGFGTVRYESEPAAAVAAADYIYTDVWVSMGFEDETAGRLKSLAPYQVNGELVAAAPAGVKVLHCLPAHRGEEITDEVMDGRNAVVFDQAENRLHVQKAIMALMCNR